jgi:hypothetical protein
MAAPQRAIHYNECLQIIFQEIKYSIGLFISDYVKKKFEAGAMSRTFLVEKEEKSNKLFILKIVSYYTPEEISRAN